MDNFGAILLAAAFPAMHVPTGPLVDRLSLLSHDMPWWGPRGRAIYECQRGLEGRNCARVPGAEEM